MKILFLCVANSARSQIAEGLAKKILGTGHDIRSAGSNPSGVVHPLAIEVMHGAGIDISKHQSKSWNDLPADFLDSLDVVITLCAEEICPNLSSGAKKLHWGLPDPAASSADPKSALKSFEQTRIEIENRLKNFAI